MVRKRSGKRRNRTRGMIRSKRMSEEEVREVRTMTSEEKHNEGEKGQQQGGGARGRAMRMSESEGETGSG